MKRSALQEMVEFINNNNGIITEAIYPEMIQMVSEYNLILKFDVNSVPFFPSVSLPSISSVHCPRLAIRAAQNSIPRKMSPHWNHHGRICRLSMSSFYAFWNRPIFSRTLRSVTLTVNLSCDSWISSIRRTHASVTFSKRSYIVSMENSWASGHSFANKLTTFSTGELY